MITSTNHNEKFPPQGSQQADISDPRYRFLHDWLTDNEADLWKALYSKSRKIADLRGLSAQETTDELLNEVTLIALGKVYQKYDIARFPSPCLWLLRIASFVVLRWQDEAYKHNTHSLTVDFDADYSAEAGIPSDFSPRQNNDPAHLVSDKLWIEGALSQLTPDDRELIEQRNRNDLSFFEVAQLRGTTEGAVRVRYCRIIKRLRQAQQAADTHVAIF